MFVLVEMVDTVRTPPWQFERKLNDSIAEELNKKLANKVVYNVGLCICLFDITKLEDAYVFPGDGASHTKVHFRYVVFHPFLDEILIGKIKGCSPEGVHVSLGFFDDILIPPESLQQPAKFDEAEQVWVWEYETEEGAHDLYMDTGEDVRFRVVDESFVDTSPTGPSSAEAASSSEELPKKEAPYTLVVSCPVVAVETSREKPVLHELGFSSWNSCPSRLGPGHVSLWGRVNLRAALPEPRLGLRWWGSWLMLLSCQCRLVRPDVGSVHEAFTLMMPESVTHEKNGIPGACWKGFLL
ncbi:DNA-directed RNA polymerase III subunit RPC8 isoform X1 [Tamandua tetradactyla]|uniref:DNA-directed RNA polymerase III subunit RPC8 isoform X1 n=1 Tax=Tamandua tetradactyla TaxID=48850 RepID=UPI004053DC27